MAKKKYNKEIEAEKPSAIEKAEQPAIPDAPKMDFEAWYALRKDGIPSVHKKEIIKADFKARKIPMKNTIEEFDLALKKYGVELK